MTSALDSVPFRVTDPERIPAQRYYDAEFFELEREHLWPKVWQMAARLEEIPEVGDYVEYTILDKSVIVVRGKDGVKAYHNACRHRGVRLANGPGNCAEKGFICPFHGWRWNSEGESTHVFGKQVFSESVLDAAEIALQPVRCEEWAGCAFINFDMDAPPLRESLGPVANRMDARHADKLKMEWWFGTILPTNWKLALEAFQEGYHVMQTHPQLHELGPFTGATYGPNGDDWYPNMELTSDEVISLNKKWMARLSSGMAGMVHESEVEVLERMDPAQFPDDPQQAAMMFYAKGYEAVAEDGYARGLPMFDIPKVMQEVEFNAVEYMFPHYFLLPMFASMSSYRVRPLTPETCLFEIWSLTMRPDGEEYDTPTGPTMLPYDSPDFPEIPRQDYSNLPIQQLGLHNFEEMRLSHSEEGTISNYQRLLDGYLAGLDNETLRKAQNAVNDGYNKPIADIGF
ncbi:MAG: aromatic ring-hydroxylating dioxygenase subunit alpha [Sphingomonadaceae bacterium]